MKTYQITDDELQIIFQALGELPLKIAGPIFGSLDVQRREQEIKDKINGSTSTP